MIDRATLEQIYEICTSRPRAAALRDLADLIADIEHAAMLADSIKITSKAAGQPIDADKVDFKKAFTHTSEINGQPIIAYDLIASQLARVHNPEAKTDDEINAENKAYVRQLNAGMTEQLKRLNQR